ncbi:MAG: hypothetical protein BJ554DRAFT_1786, partial [Olpidium bornovanus]
DQAEAHRQKAKAARERRQVRVAYKKDLALAEYSAKADETAPVALPAKAEKKDAGAVEIVVNQLSNRGGQQVGVFRVAWKSGFDHLGIVTLSGSCIIRWQRSQEDWKQHGCFIRIVSGHTSQPQILFKIQEGLRTALHSGTAFERRCAVARPSNRLSTNTTKGGSGREAEAIEEAETEAGSRATRPPNPGAGQ